MQSVAAAWLVLQLSHNSAFALAIYGACQYGPILLFGLIAGTIVDRLVHRDLLIVNQTLAAAGAAVYAVLSSSHLISLPLVYVIATVLGLNQALYFPSRQAVVLEMVGREELASAVALNSIAFNVARIIGPAVAGLAVAATGVATAFLLNALSFLFVIGALLTIRRRPVTARSGMSTWHLIREGFGHIRAAPTLAALFFLLFVAGTFGANFNLVLPVFTRVSLHANADVLGYLFAAQGIGALAGALTMTTTGGFLLNVRRILLGGLFFGLLELLFVTGPGFAQTAVLLVAIGWAFAVYTIGTNTMIQVLAPDHLQGRMVSLYAVLFIGVTPIGNFFAGAVADALGPPAAVWVGGALTVIAGAATVALLRSG
jgi:predicted MFS family arabinose efflux permease